MVEPMVTRAPSRARRGRSSTLVIIPAKDEQEALPSVLATLADVVPDLDVAVIDDGSTDATADVARAGGATVLSLPFNLGIGGALRTGFRYAVREGYERGVQFDADGQHDATQIAALLAALDDGADMVIGNRFGGHSHSYELGRVRAGAMGVMRFFVRQFSGQRFTDTSSGFRGFGPDVLDLFAREYPSEYMESVEALLLACSEGFRVDEVPIRMHNRELGQASNRRFRLLYHYLRMLLVITAQARPRRRAERRRRARDAGSPSGRPAGPATEPSSSTAAAEPVAHEVPSS
jgi:glycosyltransferase involved in cell wall biosynthesis